MTVSVIQITVSHVMATDIQYNYNISCRLIPVCLGSEISQRLIFCCTKCTARSDTIHCKRFGSPSSAVEDLCPPGHDAGSLDKQFWHFEQLQCLPNSRNCLHNNTAARNLESSNLHYARKWLYCVKLFIATIAKKNPWLRISQRGLGRKSRSLFVLNIWWEDSSVIMKSIKKEVKFVTSFYKFQHSSYCHNYVAALNFVATVALLYCMQHFVLRLKGCNKRL